MSAHYVFRVFAVRDDGERVRLGDVEFPAHRYGDDQTAPALALAESELSQVGRFMRWRKERWPAEVHDRLDVEMKSSVNLAAAEPAPSAPAPAVDVSLSVATPVRAKVRATGSG